MTDRRIGVQLAFGTVPQALDLIMRAEGEGVGAAWVTSGGLGPDSLTTLAVAASRTSRILLGTSIAVSFSRHPLAMAQQALAIAQVAPGRLRLGIGTSHRQTVEETLGIAFDRPLEHLGEYAEVVRHALSGETFAYQGKRFRARGRMPMGTNVPIYLSALRAGSFRLAGTVAEGAIAWVSPSAYLRDIARPALLAGAATAGRATPALIGHAFGLVTDDDATARSAGEERLRGYARMTFYQEMFAAAGHPEARGGRIAEPLVRDLVLVGDETAVRAGIERFLEAGCDEIIVTLLPGKEADVSRTLRLLANVGAS